MGELCAKSSPAARVYFARGQSGACAAYQCSVTTPGSVPVRTAMAITTTSPSDSGSTPASAQSLRVHA